MQLASDTPPDDLTDMAANAEDSLARTLRPLVKASAIQPAPTATSPVRVMPL